jgi:hypothetical protein
VISRSSRFSECLDLPFGLFLRGLTGLFSQVN